MGRRGPQPTAGDRLLRRGSQYAHKRIEQEKRKDVSESVDELLVTEQLVIALSRTDIHGGNMTEVARASRVSSSTISQFIAGNTNLSGQSIDQLCYSLSLKLVWKDGTEIE